MDNHNDFDNVSWRNDPESDNSRPNTAEASRPLPTRNASTKRPTQSAQTLQAGQFADPVDLAGVGDGIIECTVDSPLKENDGTKDAHISYLVTTHVRRSLQQCSDSILILATVRLSILPETHLLHPSPIHRLCLSQKYTLPEFPSLCRPPITREEQPTTCARGGLQYRIHIASSLVVA